MTSQMAEQVREALASIRGLPGVTMRPGVSAGDLLLLERQLGCYLPAVYRALLLETNGVEVAHGCSRWLGYGPGAPIDVAAWNDPATWKWAFRDWYHDLLDGFLIVAVHADGHLTGCFKRDLQRPDADPPFFGITPIAQPIRANRPLSVALFKGLVSVAREPRGDSVGQAILDRFGRVPAEGLVVHSPLKFPHFSDDETDLDGAVVLPAIDAMITKADVWRQVSNTREGDEIVGVEEWTDDRGRQRLRFQVERSP